MFGQYPKRKTFSRRALYYLVTEDAIFNETPENQHAKEHTKQHRPYLRWLQSVISKDNFAYDDNHGGPNSIVRPRLTKAQMLERNWRALVPLGWG